MLSKRNESFLPYKLELASEKTADMQGKAAERC